MDWKWRFLSQNDSPFRWLSSSPCFRVQQLVVMWLFTKQLLETSLISFETINQNLDGEIFENTSVKIINGSVKNTPLLAANLAWLLNALLAPILQKLAGSETVKQPLSDRFREEKLLTHQWYNVKAHLYYMSCHMKAVLKSTTPVIMDRDQAKNRKEMSLTETKRLRRNHCSMGNVCVFHV